MGNKLCMLFSCQHPKKPRKIEEKAACNYDIIESYFTPKSHQSDQDDNQDAEMEDVSPDPETTFVCQICTESWSLYDSFNPKGCTHFFCTQCVVRYVASKLDDNTTYITCPISNCDGVLDSDYCRHILPKKVFDRWGIAICESVIGGSEKFYCPYQDCSVLLINDRSVAIEQEECPSCKRQICVKCKVPWHSEIDCERFQKLKKKGKDGMLKDLVKRKNWRRCPHCKFYVERSSGCNHMVCRCGKSFCYKCGARLIKCYRLLMVKANFTDYEKLAAEEKSFTLLHVFSIN